MDQYEKFTIDIRECQIQNSIPYIRIDGKKLALVSLDISWRTKTENANSGKYIAYISGYLNESTKLQNFIIDILNGTIVEVN